jgi:molybdopterin/thiamine biosynthesis adenylyltransferase
MDEGRYSRNEALFGAAGQERIAETRVAIVGLGGLGCHVAQQLAYLGVIRFVLIDGDVVTWSSLNRLIGAREDDARRRTPKVRVAQRLIRAIQPTGEIAAVDQWLDAPEAGGLISQVDAIFGCLDQERARLDLLELAATHAMPYWDLASDTGGEQDELWYGGRIVFASGSGCCVCLDVLDQRELRLEQMTRGEREAAELLYGVRSDVLAGSGPAVVSINGVVASLAVTEFIAWTTGIRTPATQITYRGDISSVRKSTDSGRPGCFYCAKYRAEELPTAAA